MHQHHSATRLRTHARHRRIPAKAADVVHNLRARRQSRAAPSPPYTCQPTQPPPVAPAEFPPAPAAAAPALPPRSPPEPTPSPRQPRTRPRALRTQVQQVRPFVQQPQPMLHRRVAIKKSPAIAERIRRNIHHTHHQRPPAEFQRTGAQPPCANCALQVFPSFFHAPPPGPPAIRPLPIL